MLNTGSKYFGFDGDKYEMRVHHACNVADFAARPHYFIMSETDFIGLWASAFPDNIRPDDFVLEYRMMMGDLVDHPEKEILIVEGSDKICGKCPTDMSCNSPDVMKKSHAYRKDMELLEETPGLKMGQSYTVREIIALRNAVGKSRR